MIVGVLMLVMGLHIHGLQGNCETFKLTNEHLASLQDQLSSGSNELSVTLYYESLLLQQE